MEGDPNALGYFGYAYYQANKDKVKAVAIDSGKGCIVPSADTVFRQAYQPLSRPLLLYVNVDSAARPAVREFLRSFISAAGAEQVAKVGYVPLPMGAQVAQNSRFDKGAKGSALGGHGSVLAVKMDWFNVDEEE